MSPLLKPSLKILKNSISFFQGSKNSAIFLTRQVKFSFSVHRFEVVRFLYAQQLCVEAALAAVGRLLWSSPWGQRVLYLGLLYHYLPPYCNLYLVHSFGHFFCLSWVTTYKNSLMISHLCRSRSLTIYTHGLILH